MLVRRILIVSYHHLDEQSVGSRRTRALVEFLSKHNVQAYVLSHRPKQGPLEFDGNFITAGDFSRVSSSVFTLSMFTLFRLCASRLGMYVGFRYKWKKIIFQNLDAIRSYAQPDVVFCTYPPIEALEIGIEFAKRYGTPLITDFRDGLLFDCLESDLETNTAKRSLYQRIEQEAVRFPHMITTVTQPHAEYLRARYQKNNIHTIYNGYTHSESESYPSPLPDKVINIVYTGTLSASSSRRTIDDLIEALRIVDDCQNSSDARRIQLHFIGSLSRTERSKLSVFTKSGLVKLWGQKTYAEARSFQINADFLLLVVSEGGPSGVPGKLLEYLGTHKPIIALTAGTEAEKIIAYTKTGISIPPHDFVKIAQCFIDIKNGHVFPHAPKVKRIEEFSHRNQFSLLVEKMHSYSLDVE